MNIAYYISSHGYGHFARAVIVIDKLLEKNKVYIKSDLPKKLFTTTLKHKNYKIYKSKTDVGCIQKNFIDIDIEKTLETALKQHKYNLKNIDKEKKWLIKNKIDLVISDVPYFPIYISAKLNIPNIVFSNFTWYDIYNGFPKQKKLKYLDLIKEIKICYSLADIQISPEIPIKNNYIKKQKKIGFIKNKGNNIRIYIEEKYNIKNKKIIFIYLGDYGSENFNWKNLYKLKDYVFISKDKNSFKTANNLINLSYTNINHKDLIASSDIIVMKLGYSTLSICISHKKKILFCSRKYFKEFNVMRKYVEQNKIGICIKNKDFFNCNWHKYIKKNI